MIKYHVWGVEVAVAPNEKRCVTMKWMFLLRNTQMAQQQKPKKSFVSALQGEIIPHSYNSIEIMSDIENLWKPPAKISYTSIEFLIHFNNDIC